MTQSHFVINVVHVILFQLMVIMNAKTVNAGLIMDNPGKFEVVYTTTKTRIMYGMDKEHIKKMLEEDVRLGYARKIEIIEINEL